MDHTYTFLLSHCLLLWYDIFSYHLDLCASTVTDHMNESFYLTQWANSIGTWMQSVHNHVPIAGSLPSPLQGRQGRGHTVLSCVQSHQANALMIWKMIVSSLRMHHLFTSCTYFPNSGAIYSTCSLIFVSYHLKIYPVSQSFVMHL